MHIRCPYIKVKHDEIGFKIQLSKLLLSLNLAKNDTQYNAIQYNQHMLGKSLLDKSFILMLFFSFRGSGKVYFHDSEKKPVNARQRVRWKFTHKEIYFWRRISNIHTHTHTHIHNSKELNCVIVMRLKTVAQNIQNVVTLSQLLLKIYHCDKNKIFVNLDLCKNKCSNY